MRVSLRDAKSGEPYRLQNPPYIRGTVVSRYFRNQTNKTTSFETTDAHQTANCWNPSAASTMPKKD